MYRFFRAEELQQIVVGAVVIDWKQIEDNAKYHDGSSYQFSYFRA